MAKKLQNISENRSCSLAQLTRTLIWHFRIRKKLQCTKRLSLNETNFEQLWHIKRSLFVELYWLWLYIGWRNSFKWQVRHRLLLPHCLPSRVTHQRFRFLANTDCKHHCENEVYFYVNISTVLLTIFKLSFRKVFEDGENNCRNVVYFYGKVKHWFYFSLFLAIVMWSPRYFLESLTKILKP